MKTILLSFAILFFNILPFTLTGQVTSETKSNSVKDSLEYMFDGKILSKKGQTVTISISGQRALPSEGQNGILAKYFEQDILGMKTTGWLDIGEVKIISVKIATVTMSLEKELSVITKNGEKVDHFKAGNIVHFTWKK